MTRRGPGGHSRYSALEKVFQPELYESRCDRGTSDFAETRATDDSARIAKLRVIERVEKLGAALQRRSFVQPPNLGRLGKRYIKVRLVRSAERSSAEIAVRRAIPDLGKRARGTGRVNGGAIEIAPLTLHPYAATFEELRDATDAYAKAHQNKRPKVFLANIGTPKEFLARANYASDFFEAGGFAPITNDGFADSQAAAAAFAASGAKIGVICSTDKRYETEVERVAPALKTAGARTVVLAGNPAANEMKYRSVGVNQFIFVKCNVPDILRALLKEEGVL